MAPIRCCFDQTAVWHSDAARGPSTPSFDHLVGERQQFRRYFETERLCGLEVDHQLELGRRLHRKLGRIGALEDAVNVCCRPPVYVAHLGPIGQKTAARRIETIGIDRGRRWRAASAMMRSRPFTVLTSGSTIRPPFAMRAKASMTASMPAASGAVAGIGFTANEDAAASMGRRNAGA